MDGHLLGFIRDLQDVTTFEAAAEKSLGAILAACDGALSVSVFAGQGRVLRAAIHIRPEDAYRRIAARDAVNGAPEATPYAHSATAWRWVRERGRPIAIDVHLGVVQVYDGRGFAVMHEARALPFENRETRKRLLGRDATHLLVLPLRAMGSALAGMVSVEAEARSAMGTPFIWPEAMLLVQAIADVAAPYLLSLSPATAEVSAADPLLPVVGASMRLTVDMLRVFSQQEETVLLSGPTGAGKSRLARWCHDVSPRRGKPFETLDLAAVPEELRGAELFGWKRGAFTGATKDTMGCVGRAEGGTLFIDEVDKLSLKAQAGLLRVLEERKFRPLGEDERDRTADVRFIVGTNVSLLHQVREGRFREDLYYRIHVLPVRIPPLAERRDEIAAWARYMLRRRHEEAGAKGEAVLAPEAERVLETQPWPGNLRQLNNIVRRAYALFLVTAGPGAAPLVVGAPLVERALLYEGEPGPRSFVDLLHAAAAAFVAEAERRATAGPLDLELTEAFRGFVLGAAAQKLGGVEAAFRLFGKGLLVQHRNHLKTLRKELGRVDRVYEAFGAGTSPFEGLGEEA